MESVVKVAKTVDGAVEEALEELKATREDVEIEVLEEPSRGLLGILGVKDAVVKVTVTYDPVKIADEFLDKILLSMGLIGSSNITREDDILFIDIENIDPKDMGMIIGRRGATLDAIQYLLSLVLNKDRDAYIKVILDINNYREKREETLIRLAERMAKKAKKTKRLVKLEPMNPYERRIIHSALQDVEYVTTFSEGEEPYRRVVIKLK